MTLCLTQGKRLPTSYKSKVTMVIVVTHTGKVTIVIVVTRTGKVTIVIVTHVSLQLILL